ncbi:ERF family protein [Nitrobacter sp.]|uniref:ERF family protein n=1 Tax=Nitrobacter sp. TaxID=29420 RepID=UPI0032205C88
MRRSSENVAAIATALAKAQIELANPAKSMLGSVYPANIHESPKSFRYAPLSGGLEIIRKALGGQQIAVTQTTEIDATNGLVNLTTLLIHTSGEWISSDWPICRLSEISAPRRMGAALTYARRYALFTLVGIAGDDDLDGPDINPQANAAEVQQVAAGPANEPSRGSSASSVNSAADIEVTRTGLLAEIAALPTMEQMQARAANILKAKNRLPPEDAKHIEAAFSARMMAFDNVQSHSDSAPIAIEDKRGDKTVITPVVAPKRRRRRAKTAVGARELDLEPHGISKAPASETTEPSKIDKSVLTFGEPRRKRDKQHLRFVASQPCLICGRAPSDAHHLRFAQLRAMGRKSSDEFVVPLCRTHHRENHQTGREESWWASMSIDPLEIATKLWSLSHGSVAASIVHRCD